MYGGAERRISPVARDLLATEEVFTSPVAELELTCLYEVGRVSEPAAAPLAALRRSIGLRIADVSLTELVNAARDLSWTRDPFDRLIAAHAIVADVQLVTADQTIRENLSLATWS